MHGRGLSLTTGPLRAAQERAREPLSIASGFRNLIEFPEGKALRVGGNRTYASSPKDLEPLQNLMAGVARRMERGFVWENPIGDAVDIHDNPNIPSGYTYLLQFVAHDLVQSAMSLSLTEDENTTPVNYRLSPLRLDTVYGGGPDVCPFAYAKHSRDATLPRTRLRLGRIKPSGAALIEAPPRDIARAPHDEEPTLPATDKVASGPMPGLSEPLIPDPRNDDHAIISQLTTLFHILHNGVLEMMDTEDQQSSVSEAAARYRHFACARAAVTTVYRNIVRTDLLQRLLHPAVYALYEKSGKTFLGDWNDRVPLEFSHGAFRCGHAMVRREYRINNDTPLPTSEALRQNSLRGATKMPLGERWVVQWSCFFAIAGSQPNLSRRIGPDYSTALVDSSQFPPVDDAQKEGLAYRDLMSASLAGLWPVRQLIDKIKENGALAGLRFLEWETPLREWLKQYPNATGLTEINPLLEDPPLPMFVLFEAAQEMNGERLGTLGSVIVAEVLFGALAQGQSALSALMDGMPSPPGFVSGLKAISTMEQLITFVADKFGLRHQQPAFI